MFTGLVEEKGILARRLPRGPGARLAIRCRLQEREPLVLGESIAVDGVCLTVETILADGFEVDASAETLARSTLGSLREGAEVNLERATKLGDRMGGHIVSGHVDGTGTLVERASSGDAFVLTFEAPKELARYIAEKGSVCVSGVSLTVNGVAGARFDVAVIPVTQSVTSIGGLAVGAKVNLEVDVLARYVARILEVGGAGDAGESRDAAWLERLKRGGYL